MPDPGGFFKLQPIRPDRLPLTNEGDNRCMVGTEKSPPIDPGSGETVVKRLEVVQGFLNRPDVGVVEEASQRRKGPRKIYAETPVAAVAEKRHKGLGSLAADLAIRRKATGIDKEEVFLYFP